MGEGVRRKRRLFPGERMIGRQFGIGWRAAVFVIALAAAVAGMREGTAWAMDAGTYLVTVAPSYKDPETGSVDDPGNNAAIGQGMTERMCGSTGLLEVGSSGEMYLTVRYYLSQFIRDVSFEERIGGTYLSRAYQTMQTKEAVESSNDIGEKYGYTDYRIPIGDMNSVFRGKAYVEAMGRSVVFFFTISDARSGHGDFIVSSQTDGTETGTAAGQETSVSATQVGGDTLVGGDTQTGTQYVLTEETDSAGASVAADEWPEEWGKTDDTAGAAVSTDETETDKAVNGRGSVDDPVTGIPVKPMAQTGSSTGQTGTRTGQSGSADRTGDQTTSEDAGTGAGVTEESVGKTADAAEYHLETSYNLSAVPIREARKLAEPMLEEATGIAGIAGELEAAETLETGTAKKETNGNRLIMMALLGAAALLLVWFAAAGMRPAESRKNKEREPEGAGAQTDMGAISGQTGIHAAGEGQEQSGGRKR